MDQIGNEDEFLSLVFNVENSIGTIGFFGQKNELLYCITHTEMLSLWNIETAEKVGEYTDIREQLSLTVPINYLIDCSYDINSNKLYLLSGTSDGHCVALEVVPGCVLPSFTLPSVHTEVIRSIYWEHKENRIITGGEDSRIVSWTPTASSTTF